MADIKQISDKALIRDIENAAFAAGVKYAKDQESTPEYKDNLKKEAQYRVEIMRRLADLAAVRQERDDARVWAKAWKHSAHNKRFIAKKRGEKIREMATRLDKLLGEHAAEFEQLTRQRDALHGALEDALNVMPSQRKPPPT